MTLMVDWRFQLLRCRYFILVYLTNEIAASDFSQINIAVFCSITPQEWIITLLHAPISTTDCIIIIVLNQCLHCNTWVWIHNDFRTSFEQSARVCQPEGHNIPLLYVSMCYIMAKTNFNKIQPLKLLSIGNVHPTFIVI